MNEHSKNILSELLAGNTASEIATRFGVSRQCICQSLTSEDRVAWIAYKETLRNRKKKIELAFKRHRKRREWKNKPEDRFWENVDIYKENECWEWKRARMSTKGYEYGHVSWGNRREYAHRIAWALANKREIPKGMFICHHCDNAPCCNPKHLFLGTPMDNVKDSIAKGRRKKGKKRRKRERVRYSRQRPHYLCKLTVKQADEARKRRRNGETLRSIAESYGVTRPVIADLVTDRTKTYREK